VAAVDEHLVEVYMAGPNDAELMRSLLEGDGISATTVGSGASGAYPVSVGSLGETRVYVRAADEERARELISDLAPRAPERHEPAPVRTAVDAKWIAIAVLLVVVLGGLAILDAYGGP
jgi:hypothetical protein